MSFDIYIVYRNYGTGVGVRVGVGVTVKVGVGVDVGHVALPSVHAVEWLVPPTESSARTRQYIMVPFAGF